MIDDRYADTENLDTPAAVALPILWRGDGGRRSLLRELSVLPSLARGSRRGERAPAYKIPLPMKGPPFSRRVRGLDAIPLNEILLYTGASAWDEGAAPSSRAKMIYPYERFIPPEGYDWSIVRGFTVTILHSGGVPEPILDDLADALVKAGALRVTIISPQAYLWIRTVGPEVAA